ncbi:MAG: phycocyanobilin:ferredoxin oxidoreductase [Cyanobacteria bacterium MAG CAR4_bin_6]|nr:phycocyanobilin:ferredoxin oxidoreductase [Cyanobacteria bacterium MAG CAR4_bin_6]MCY4234741.1 phycocyanobilin:ferredoxin oxidoreductase [Cyanobacteria bacterium MAG CAR2_bin_4]
MTSTVTRLGASLSQLLRRTGLWTPAMDNVDAAAICTHPLVLSLAQSIQTHWRKMEQCKPLALPRGMERVKGAMDDGPVQIRNCCFSARGFRKMHLELASIGPGLNILHAVMFPDPCWDLPLFGCDVVAARGQVSAAVVDLSPTAEALPPSLNQRLQALPRPDFSEPRQLPPWGDIFSTAVCFIRPRGVEEEQGFQELAVGYLRLLLAEAGRISPDSPDHPATVARKAAQLRYCRQQQCNDKTRRVLAKAFGEPWAEDYIRHVLFDEPDS